MKHNDVLEMEVFRTGDYGPKGTYSDDDLDAIAADYRADLLEAPLTFDHAQTGPAFGWVSALRREGDRLVAVLKGVPAAVKDLLRAGAYKRRSVELFRTLPHTGRPYLRAVSLLGAATPEVKGLREVCFASQEDACALEFSSEDAPPAAATPVPAPAAVPPIAQPDRITPKLTALFADLRRDGYCLAEDDATAISALFSAAGDPVAPPTTEVSSFQEDSASAVDSGLDCLSRLLRQALLRAPLGEHTIRSAGAAGQGVLATQFSDRVEPRSFALHQAALQIINQEPELSYRDALLRAGR